MMVSETTDLISRSALLEELREERDWFKDVGEKATAGVIALAMKRTRNAPAVDAVPVVHARWDHWGGDEWQCTNCASFIYTEGSWEKPWQKYCPNCGAKMDGGAE